MNSAVAHPEIAAKELKVVAAVAEVQRLHHAVRRRVGAVLL